MNTPGMTTQQLIKSASDSVEGAVREIMRMEKEPLSTYATARLFLHAQALRVAAEQLNLRAKVNEAQNN